jgi:hypothetical protein
LNPELDFIHVSPIDIFTTFAVMVSINLVVLVTWTLVSPLEWSRLRGDETDMFDRLFQSYGTCESPDSVAFIVVIIVINVIFLILGNWWNYMSRNIETEYGESRYIGISMAATLQAWGMGIPILVVVWDNPQARFFVESGIIFVTSLAFLATVYLPKMFALRDDRAKTKDSRTQAYSNYQARAKQPSDYEAEESGEEDEEEDQYDGTLPVTMQDVKTPEDGTQEEAKVAYHADDQNPQEAAPAHHGENEMSNVNDAVQSEDMAAHPNDMNGGGNHAGGAKRRVSNLFGSIINGNANAPAPKNGGGIKVLHHPKVSLCVKVFSVLWV